MLIFQKCATKQPKKYKIGDRITSFHSLVRELDSNNYVYYRGQVKHPSFVSGMVYRTLRSGISLGIFNFATVTDEWLMWSNQQPF